MFFDGWRKTRFFIVMAWAQVARHTWWSQNGVTSQSQQRSWRNKGAEFSLRQVKLNRNISPNRSNNTVISSWHPQIESVGNFRAELTNFKNINWHLRGSFAVGCAESLQMLRLPLTLLCINHIILEWQDSNASAQIPRISTSFHFVQNCGF